MKLASIRRFRSGVSQYAKKGKLILITLGHQIAASLTAKKITEKEILDDFKAFKKARCR